MVIKIPTGLESRVNEASENCNKEKNVKKQQQQNKNRAEEHSK